MKKMFNYNKFNDETLDSLVEAFGSLSDAYVSGKSNTAEYKEANRKFNEDFMRECASAMPTYDAEKFSMEDFKNPMVHKNIFMLEKFDTILAQMITPVLPKIIADGYEGLYDVTVRLVAKYK